MNEQVRKCVSMECGSSRQANYFARVGFFFPPEIDFTSLPAPATNLLNFYPFFSNGLHRMEALQFIKQLKMSSKGSLAYLSIVVLASTPPTPTEQHLSSLPVLKDIKS